MNFSKIRTIALREYLAIVRSKAFILSILLMPVFMFGSIAIQSATSKVKDLHEQWYAVIDRTPGGVIFKQLEEDVEKRNAGVIQNGVQTEPYFRIHRIDAAPAGPGAETQRLELSREIRDGMYVAVVEIGADIFQPPVPGRALAPTDATSIRYQSDRFTAFAFRNLVVDSVNRVVRQKRLAGTGLDAATFSAIAAPVPVLDKGLDRLDASGHVVASEQSTRMLGFFIPFGLAMLTFMVVMIGAVPMLQGVVEEKQARIAEVLLASVKPFDLMAGKVIGLVATSATLMAVYLTAGVIVLSKMGLGDYMPMRLLPWLVLFMLINVLMYGSLYIAIGASVNEPKELQSLMLPINLLAVLPLLILSNVLQNPHGPLAVIGTWCPLSAPIITIVRLAIPPGLSPWIAAGAAGSALLATIVFIWAAGRIFRVGILMQGKPPRVGDLLRWAIRG